MRSYEGARFLFGLMALVAWGMVVVGVIIAFSGAGAASQFGARGSSFLAALPGLGISILGLFQIAFIQNARATVDTAEYTQQMLQVSRDQLQVSKQIEKQNKKLQQSYADLKTDAPAAPAKSGYSKKKSKPAKPEKTATPKKTKSPKIIPKVVVKEIEYSGATILETDGVFRVESAEFKELDFAKSYIDLLVEKVKMAEEITNLNAAAVPPEPEPIVEIAAPVVEVLEPDPAPPTDPQLVAEPPEITVPVELADNEIEYAGRVIAEVDGAFIFARMSFKSLESAKRYVDQLGVNPKVNLGGVTRQSRP